MRRCETRASGKTLQQFIKSTGCGAHHEDLGRVDRAAPTRGHDKAALAVGAPEITIEALQTLGIGIALDIAHHTLQPVSKQAFYPRDQTGLMCFWITDQNDRARAT